MFTEPITNDELLCAHDFSDDTSLDPVRTYGRRFEGNLMPRTEAARSFLTRVLVDFEVFEQTFNTRKRKRRLADQQLFTQQVEAVLCETICRELIARDEWLAISFSHRFLGRKCDRYTPNILTEKVVYVIKTLAHPVFGLLDLELGHRDFHRPSQSCLSVFRASPKLVQEIKKLGLSRDDFVTSLDTETIVLKASKSNAKAIPKRIDYTDDSVTTAYRQEMTIINTWLHQADISCLPCCSSLAEDASIDVSSRTLSRTFSNGSFTQCGRLFGGFWVNMKKQQRPERLRLGGKKIVELDYQSMIAKLLYAHAGEEMPQGDAYSIPGLEGCRQGVKRLFAAMLNVNQLPTRFPSGIRCNFPKKFKVGEVIQRIVDAHPRVAQHFGTEIGLHLMFKESKIMVDLLLALKQMGIVALPVHDAVLVPEGTEESVMRVMVETFQRHTGMQGVVVKG